MSSPSQPTRFSQQPPLPQQEIDGADADLFDYAKARDYLGFALGALRRHRVRALVVLGITVGVAVGMLKVLPKTYSSEVKIQAQRNQVISNLAGISRASDFDSPTRSAADMVTRSDNLVSLVRKTDLVKVWAERRSSVLRLKDLLMAKLGAPVSQQVREEMMVGLLETRITVTTGEDTVTIEVQWPDAQSAYRLVQAAHENFLESRQFKEVSAVSEAIGLLQSRLGDERQKVTEAVEHVQQLRNAAKTRSNARHAIERGKAKPKAVAAAPSADPELQRLRAAMQGKQQAIDELDEIHRRRVAQLEAKLVELKQVYSEQHPAVIEAQTSLEQAKADPPQLASLREDLRRAEEEYERRGGHVLDTAQAGTRVSAALPPEAARLALTLNDELESSEIEQAKNELRYVVAKYATMLERIDSAKLDRETQLAAFRYRYSTLRPASMPQSPIKPKAVPIIGGAAFAGLLFGLLAAILADLRTRRIYEKWQVERFLELPVLAEVKPQ